MDTNTLLQSLQTVTQFIGDHPLDSALGNALNQRFPAEGPLYRELLEICIQGTKDGWICAHEHKSIRYGRVIPASEPLNGFSCDIVRMHDIVGPRHTHPAGEIDLILPIQGAALFDGHPAGWLVYGPGTTHRPTVSAGEAYVLYLLPQGQIEFH